MGGLDHQRDGSIAVLTLTRPPINALDREALGELDRLLKDLESTRHTRAVVIASGLEGVFCTGGDLKYWRTVPDGADVARAGRSVFGRLESSPLPTIAAINGQVIGDGLALALACDLRIAAPGATFRLPELGYGFIPGWGTISRLTSAVGRARATRLLLTGQGVEAREAAAIGLVGHVVSPGRLREEAIAQAHHLAAASTTALRAAKCALRGSDDPTCFARIWGRADWKEGIEALLQRRPPRFSDQDEGVIASRPVTPCTWHLPRSRMAVWVSHSCSPPGTGTWTGRRGGRASSCSGLPTVTEVGRSPRPPGQRARGPSARTALTRMARVRAGSGSVVIRARKAVSSPASKYRRVRARIASTLPRGISALITLLGIAATAALRSPSGPGASRLMKARAEISMDAGSRPPDAGAPERARGRGWPARRGGPGRWRRRAAGRQSGDRRGGRRRTRGASPPPRSRRAWGRHRAVLVAGARAPQLVTRDMVATMKEGAVIVDISVDQGGCVETVRPTTLPDPVCIVGGVVHHGVAKMPALVPRTSTFALTNATLPDALELAAKGPVAAARENPALAKGVNIWRGWTVHPAVAEAIGEHPAPPEACLH